MIDWILKSILYHTVVTLPRQAFANLIPKIPFKGVVAVPVKTACNKAIGQNKRPQKPRASFRDLRFFKVNLAAPQIHFLKISWQCNSSPGDQILMKLSPM